MNIEDVLLNIDSPKRNELRAYVRGLEAALRDACDLLFKGGTLEHRWTPSGNGMTLSHKPENCDWCKKIARVRSALGE